LSEIEDTASDKYKRALRLIRWLTPQLLICYIMMLLLIVRIILDGAQLNSSQCLVGIIDISALAVLFCLVIVMAITAHKSYFHFFGQKTQTG
jgi:hypothetical protein